MSSKGNCPDCGSPLGFMGVCYACALERSGMTSVKAGVPAIGDRCFVYTETAGEGGCLWGYFGGMGEDGGTAWFLDRSLQVPLRDRVTYWRREERNA